MKMNYALIVATMLSTSVLAQTATPTPPAPAPMPAPTAEEMVPPPGPSTNAPSSKKPLHKKKKTVKKATAPAASASATNSTSAGAFVMGDIAMAKRSNVVIRAQARITSEIVGHLQKGETVNVLGEETLKHPKVDEPAKWVRIAMPASNHVWVDTKYINAANSTVTAHKLNLRSGAGENYSVIGQLHGGDTIKSIGTKGAWTEIEAPNNAFAFVAAHLLMRQSAAVSPIASVSPSMSQVSTAPNIVPANEPAPMPMVPPTIPPVAAVPIPAPQPAADEPLPKRIVEREGIVGGTVSIQAPSHYELHSLDNGKVMDYLYTTSPNVILSRYHGLTVLVSGEEELDERWPNTPVLTIQKIQVVK